MNILGLHFGHDAAACVVRDGHVASYVMRERHSRIKHAISLDSKTIQDAMDAAQLRWDQVDYCAITSTQNMELIIDDPAGFSIELRPHPRHGVPNRLSEETARNQIRDSLQMHSLMDVFYSPAHAKSFLRHHYGSAFPEHKTRQRSDFTRFGMIDVFTENPLWSGGTLAQIAATDFSELLANDSARHGFHHPVTVRLGGRELPGYLIGHHMAHAASVFYQSGFPQSAILTHDGFANGRGYLSGMYFWGEGNRIYPVAPHHLVLGNLYNFVGAFLGLGYEGPAGKLMGLAGYGQPHFFDRHFVGNQYDWTNAGITPRSWIDHCLERARAMGYSAQFLGVPSRILEPITMDIATSTQKLFEETYLVAVETLGQVMRKAGRDSQNLCLSGGCALNCPSNSRVFREGPFREVYVEPGCDDSGLAIGAATWLYHNLLDYPLPPRPLDQYASPYLGIAIAADAVDSALAAAGDSILVTVCSDSAEAAAKDLADDRVIGWFEGPSEIGPRALGHRSILADPRPSANNDRVNQIKGREAWRPFAPAVLATEAHKWFTDMPPSSPYMLFTATVRSNDLPAITHADGSARIQTVDPSCGDFHRVIKFFFALTGVPVVLNTSFNGPGEPIVESPQDALRFFLKSKLDALYIGGKRIVRRPAA